MLKLLKYLKNSIGTVLLILVLLLVQAYCDLSLPTYTSQIVDVGIQQGGIANVAPQYMRKQTLQDLELFMTQEQCDLVEASYTLETDRYVLNTKDQKTIDALNDALGMPMLM